MASNEYKEYMKGVVHHSGNFAGKARYIHAEEVHNMTAPDMIVPIVLNLCPGVRSVVDFGCGLGTWLRAFKEHGVKEILGLEGEWCNRTLLFKNIDGTEFKTADLEKPVCLEKSYDLVISLEVAEHIAEHAADIYVKSLVSAGKVILFSAAIPFQGGYNHVNEQFPDYWQEKFRPYGYVFRDIIRPKIWYNEAVEFWYKQNMFIVAHKSMQFPVDTGFKYPVIHPELLKIKSGGYRSAPLSVAKRKTDATHESQPLISVVIPVYNGEKTLPATLAGVLKQTHTRFEVIIVDDGSDNPVEPFLRPMTEDSRIRIYRTERSNANMARNFGIQKSKGEYIAMLDADDLWLENHLSDCLALLQESKADGLYGSLLMRRSLSDNIHNLPVFHARELREGESMVDYLLPPGFGAQTSTLFTTSRSMKDILWDPGLIDHQDYDFVVRFHKKYPMAVKKEPTVAYYLSSGRAIHFESCIRFTEAHIKDINPEIYVQYNLNMYLLAAQKEENKRFASYFRKETTRYKECLTYRQYISICDPPNRFREWMDKLRFLFYMLRIQTEL